MADEVKITTPAEAATPVEPTAPEKPVEKSVAEIIEQAAPAPEKKPETVGLDKYLEIKNENKDLKKSIKDLEKKVEQGYSASEISDDIAAIGDEFDVDKGFLAKLTKAIKIQVETAADEKIKPLQKEKRDELIDKAFSKHYTEALETMPEYKDIANADVIKELSLLPKNANKTFATIIEETYGKATTGRKTIESTKPGGGKEPQPLDVARARKDTAYFLEIMADPKLKAEYNAIMLKTRM